MPTNEEENKCLSSVHQRNSGTNMHRAKTSATRGEQPGTYQCAAPMLMYASRTLPAAGAALCIAGCNIAYAMLTQAMQQLMPYHCMWNSIKSTTSLQLAVQPVANDDAMHRQCNHGKQVCHESSVQPKADNAAAHCWCKQQ